MAVVEMSPRIAPTIARPPPAGGRVLTVVHTPGVRTWKCDVRGRDIRVSHWDKCKRWTGYRHVEGAEGGGQQIKEPKKGRRKKKEKKYIETPKENKDL